jgi:hypothetical protein
MNTSTDTTCFIPTHAEEITPAWLTGVMAKHAPGAQVLSAQIGDFFGHKPNKVRVKVEYNEAGRKAGLPTSLVAKGAFKNKSGQHALSDLDLGMELELAAYADVVPHLPWVKTPRCFSVSFDAESHSGMLVLEDLDLVGAVFLRQASSLSYAQACAFIDLQARLHAQWMDSPEFEAGGRFGPGSSLRLRSDRLHTEYLSQLTRPEYWDSFLAQPRGAILPRLLQDPDRVAMAQAKMAEVHRSCAHTLAHGDEHLGNLYLDAAGQPGFIDWCARREPWAIGYIYLVVSCLDPLDRRQWEVPLLCRYLDGLTRHGAKAPSFEEAWYAYRCTMLFPFLVWISNSAKWQPESINARNTMRAALAMLDHDVFTLLGA